jgi:hypothetical protein
MGEKPAGRKSENIVFLCHENARGSKINERAFILQQQLSCRHTICGAKCLRHGSFILKPNFGNAIISFCQSA